MLYNQVKEQGTTKYQIRFIIFQTGLNGYSSLNRLRAGGKIWYDASIRKLTTSVWPAWFDSSISLPRPVFPKTGFHISKYSS